MFINLTMSSLAIRRFKIQQEVNDFLVLWGDFLFLIFVSFFLVTLATKGYKGKGKKNPNSLLCVPAREMHFFQ